MSETINPAAHLGMARDTIEFLRVKREEDARDLSILQGQFDSMSNRFDAMRRQRDGERSRARRAENRLATAEAQIEDVRELADTWETGAMRWEDPLPVPREVSLIREALGIQTHNRDRGDALNGEDPSCSCGYNGTPKECWQSRRTQGGEPNE
ncbi:hypothetical protein [Glutamicibacter ardleyensis]